MQTKYLRQHVLFLDLETGGTDWAKNDILTFAGQIVDTVSRQVVSEHTLKIHAEENRVVPRALEVNGIELNQHNSDPETVTQIQAATLLHEKFEDWAEEYGNQGISQTGRKFKTLDFGGYNVEKFDIPFLAALFERMNKNSRVEKERIRSENIIRQQSNQKLLKEPWLNELKWLISDYYSFDVQRSILDMAKAGYFENANLPNLKLSTVAEYFGFDTKDAHDALADVKLSVQVYFFIQDYNAESKRMNPLEDYVTRRGKQRNT